MPRRPLASALPYALAFLAATCCAASLAQTRETCYLTYSFYGPAGEYVIELFEVGAPYPSRQDPIKYDGQFTHRRTWNYITRSRKYFIRVTKSRQQAKQMREFKIGDVESYNAPHFNWYQQ